MAVSFSCQKEKDSNYTIYYPDSEALYFIPVNKKIEGLSNKDEAKAAEKILEELKKAPKPDLRSCVPQDVTFSDIIYNSEKKDFSLKFSSTNPLNETEEQLMLGCITNTLSEIKNTEFINIQTTNKTQMDYSEPISTESYKNSFLDVEKETDEHLSSESVYWFSKDKKYLVPVQVPIPKKDIKSLLEKLKKGPEQRNIDYFSNSIPEGFDIIIKLSSDRNIDIEIKQPASTDKSTYDLVEKAVLLTIYDLKVFDTVKVINSDSEKIVDFTKTNPKENLNLIESNLN